MVSQVAIETRWLSVIAPVTQDFGDSLSNHISSYLELSSSSKEYPPLAVHTAPPTSTDCKGELLTNSIANLHSYGERGNKPDVLTHDVHFTLSGLNHVWNLE